MLLYNLLSQSVVWLSCIFRHRNRKQKPHYREEMKNTRTVRLRCLCHKMSGTKSSFVERIPAALIESPMKDSGPNIGRCDLDFAKASDINSFPVGFSVVEHGFSHQNFTIS